MEYRYNRKKAKRRIYNLISCLLVFIPVYWFFDLFSMTEMVVIKYMILFALPVIFFLINAIKSYVNLSNEIVKIDEQGISVTNGNISMQRIEWNEVTEINFKLFQDSFGNEGLAIPYEIIIKSDTAQIVLVEALEGFFDIIHLLKNRLGDIFDISALPVDMKFRQTKMKPLFTIKKLSQ